MEESLCLFIELMKKKHPDFFEYNNELVTTFGDVIKYSLDDCCVYFWKTPLYINGWVFRVTYNLQEIFLQLIYNTRTNRVEEEQFFGITHEEVKNIVDTIILQEV